MSKKDCWILSDNLVGHEKQSISLAEKLNLNYKIIKIKKLNIVERNFFLNFKKLEFFKNPFPRFLISTGKHTAYYSFLIKQKLKKKIFSIFIQQPPINIQYFDLVIAPKHDSCEGKNVIKTNGALTKINSKFIKKISKSRKPDICKENFVTVLIGGNSRHHKIDRNILDHIINKLLFTQRKTKFNVLIMLSRRTNKKDYFYLKKKLPDKNFIFVLPGSKKISYINAIAFAKIIIVTSDSVSMVTEACSSGKPTYIIDIPTKSKKFNLFIKNLIDLKSACYLKNSISLKSKNKTLNDIDNVVEKIKKKRMN